jgi:membrane protein required for colicin V production
MTTFDWVVVSIVALSTLLAFFRGVVRELVALIAWVAGVVLALAYAPTLASMLPDFGAHPALRYAIAFALLVIAALLAGALVAWPVAKAVRAAGLGFADRFLGSIFGFVRGIVLMLALVFVAGFTTLPRSAWWQDSALVPPLVAGVFALRPHLPPELAGRLDYSPGGVAPRTPHDQQARPEMKRPFTLASLAAPRGAGQSVGAARRH